MYFIVMKVFHNNKTYKCSLSDLNEYILILSYNFSKREFVGRGRSEVKREREVCCILNM